jgi:hypothetical protein
MSFVEIKEQVANLSPEQRLEVAALIAHLGRADDPQYQVELDRKIAEMESGKRFNQCDLERLHRERTAQGR